MWCARKIIRSRNVCVRGEGGEPEGRGRDAGLSETYVCLALVILRQDKLSLVCLDLASFSCSEEDGERAAAGFVFCVQGLCCA